MSFKQDCRDGTLIVPLNSCTVRGAKGRCRRRHLLTRVNHMVTLPDVPLTGR